MTTRVNAPLPTGFCWKQWLRTPLYQIFARILSIFGALADAGVDYIHVTEHEAWQPAFAQGDASLIKLARRYAPDVALIANGGLHDPEKAEQVLREGADIIAVGKGALANPDLPRLLLEGRAARDFDPAVLGPIANIKDSELV